MILPTNTQRFFGSVKALAGGQRAVPKVALHEKDAGGLLGGTRSDIREE